MTAKDIGVAIVTTVGAAAIGSLATIWVGAYGYWNTDRSQDIQMVNIALSILGGENKDTSTPGRKYALRVLERYSGVDIPDAEFTEWAAKGTLPKDVYVPNTNPGASIPLRTYQKLFRPKNEPLTFDDLLKQIIEQHEKIMNRASPRETETDDN